MTKKTYRTAQGKVVDLGSIILQNETTRAVGNMGVNARGDLIDSNNRSVKSRTQQVSRQYRKQVTNVSDEPVKTSRRVEADESKPARVQLAPEPVETVVEAEPSMVDTADTGGLAAAIAKARAIKQESLKSPRQLKQEQSGVNKI
jgi:hypothetical protein